MERTQSRAFGGQSSVGALRRVLVHPPWAEDLVAWQRYGWRAAPDPARIIEEHGALRAALAEAGAEVVIASERVPDDPDAIYAYDPAIVFDGGAVLLRSGKDSRRAEHEVMRRELERAGVPVVARLSDPGCADGGDMCWLDGRTLLVGLGYRTDEAGVEQLRAAMPAVEVLAFDLPHHRGPGEVLHLMSVLSPIADDLAVVFLPLMPARLALLLRERGVAFVEVPEDEFDSMGPNVLALAPRVALVPEGRNPKTRGALEASGVEVHTYPAAELSKGDGGPTCLTRPLLRG